ncbi:MAG: hypothetical protein ACLRRG_03075 [Barnesiella sp.]
MRVRIFAVVFTSSGFMILAVRARKRYHPADVSGNNFSGEVTYDFSQEIEQENISNAFK